MKITDLHTPALLAEADVLRRNLTTMATALPGDRLRPHVKAHKCTALAREQLAQGHTGLTCATVGEVVGLFRAGVEADLMLANETVDARRLGEIVAEGARVTVAVDSEATIEAAVEGGVEQVVIDINVGLPRCGCKVEDAQQLASVARARGLEVRGVMGYEGHATAKEDPAERTAIVADAMAVLVEAAAAVGGDIISAGSTVTYDINTWATEIQAGSYALMDTTFAKHGTPFEIALSIESTVISVSDGYAVADCGLKALGMDHGPPDIPGAKVWFCSDEHVTFRSAEPVKVGDRIRVIPAHVDPTVAYHQTLHVVSGDDIVESWPVDLRGW